MFRNSLISPRWRALSVIRPRRRGFVAFMRQPLVVGAALSLGAFMAAPAMAQTLPPTSATPTPVWREDFSTGMTPTTPRPLYSTTVTPYNGNLYSASSSWLPGYQACNGWVLASNSTQPPVAQDSGCNGTGGEIAGGTGTATAWRFLQTMASVLATNGGDVYAVASMTNGNRNTANNVQLQYPASPLGTTTEPANPFPGLTDGHYYALSVQFAEVHCRSDDTARTAWGDASEVLTLNGAASLPVSPCSASSVRTGVGPIHLATLYSGAFLASSSSTVESFMVQNMTPDFQGNDVAFNLLQIQDVTPQLYKSFNPDANASSGDMTIGVGDPGTLTYTITNTTDLQAKTGWSFTDVLDSHVTVTDAGSTTCASSTVNASGSTVTVAGNLAAGQQSCTVTVHVTAPEGGPYLNGPDNFTSLTGLLEPNEANLNVASILLNKTAAVVHSGNAVPGVITAGDEITYTFTVTNRLADTVTDLTIDETSFSGTPGALSAPTCLTTTLAAGASTTCTATYTVTADDVTNGKITNTAIATVQDNGTPEESPPDTATVPVLNPKLTITKRADTSQLVAGQTITYTYSVNNTGDVTLNNVTIADSAATGFTGTGTLSTPACQATTLAPGAGTTCTATYTVTAADVAAKTLTNVAEVSGTVPSDPGAPPDATATTAAQPVAIRAGGAVTQVPTLSEMALALLALLLAGGAVVAQRKASRRR